MTRVARVALAAALPLVLLPLGASPAPAASDWCSSAPPTAACIQSAFRDGVPVTESDPTYRVSLVEGVYGSGWQASVDVMLLTDSLPSSELGHTWRVLVNTRAHEPRVVFARATRGPVDRLIPLVGDNLIAVEGEPVRVTGECSGAGVCPVTATREQVAFGAVVYDAVGWYASSGVPASAWAGANMWTNIDWTTFPPTVFNGTLELQVANSHFRPGGVLPVTGFLYQDLPYALVQNALFVDDPYSLVGSAMITSISGSGSGSVSVLPDDANARLRVAATGLTFSKRTIRIKRGVITPRPGEVVSAVRRAGTPTTVRVAFARGVARGSAITGYQARCYRVVSGQVTGLRLGFVAAGPLTAVAVIGVSTAPGARCQVRVRSKAGYGAWGPARGVV